MDNQEPYPQSFAGKEHDINIEVRAAELSDLDAVIDLASETIVHSISPYRYIVSDVAKAYRRNDLNTLRQMFGSPNLGVFIAETPSGEFIGHIIIVVNLTDSLTGDILSMIVDLSVKEEYRGSGAAQKLCSRAELFAKENGMQYVELGVTTSNARALFFYDKMGYKEERKRMIKQI